MAANYLIINSGGTFGMVETGSGLAPAAGLQARIEALIPELSGLFDLIDLDPLIDSSNLCPSKWQAIAELAYQHAETYQGILVIHGTDTLAYTSSALSFICGGVNLPLIVTGSQKPLEYSGTDAVVNLRASFELLKSAPSSGVYVCFGGYVLQGNRVRKISVQSYQGFDSPNAARLGLSEPSLFMVAQAPLFVGHKPSGSPQFEDGAVATLLIYPGLPAAVIDTLVGSGCEALILLSYGSGNLPSADRALIQALERAVDAGLLIVNLTQCAAGFVEQGVYEAGSELQRLGALDGFDLTPEAAFARMHFLLASCENKKAVVAAWPQPLCGEFTLR